MLEKKIKFLVHFPSIAICIICLFLLIVIFEKSENPYIFIFSLPRFLTIAALGLVAIYLLFSLLNQRLIFINNVLIINICLIVLGVEVVLRVLVADLPIGVTKLLPIHVRNYKLAEHGLMTNESIQGEGLIYSYTPGLKINKMPWVSIDKDGYRNDLLSQKPEIILLGDSVTMALNAKQDLGNIIRKEGFTVRNLGFSGYSVGHYRDAYKKFIVDRKISHKLVIINLCLCNDISESRSHFMHFNRGLNWKEYLGQAPRIKGVDILKFSWALTAAINGAYEIRERYLSSSRGKNNFITLSLAKGEIIVPYPRKNYTISINSPAWEIMEKYLKDISKYAGKEGAKVILAAYPSLMGIYAPWFSDNNRQTEIHNQNIKKITDISKRLGFIFVDYSPLFQKAVFSKNIFNRHDDYHPNDEGVQVMWKTLNPIVQKLTAWLRAR